MVNSGCYIRAQNNISGDMYTLLKPTHQYHAGKGEENPHGSNSPHTPHFSCTRVLQLATVLSSKLASHAAVWSQLAFILCISVRVCVCVYTGK